MKRILSALFIILLMTGCSTLEVSVDYDEGFEFKKAQTFVVVHEYKVPEDNLLNDRILKALNSNLTFKNYDQVTEDKADLIFVFYTEVKDKTQVNQDSYSVGFGYRFGGMMASTSNGYEYKEGTLIVDALNPKTKKIVWRAIATKELNESNTPGEKTEAVNKTINKMMEKFPTKMLN